MVDWLPNKIKIKIDKLKGDNCISQLTLIWQNTAVDSTDEHESLSFEKCEIRISH